MEVFSLSDTLIKLNAEVARSSFIYKFLFSDKFADQRQTGFNELGEVSFLNLLKLSPLDAITKFECIFEYVINKPDADHRYLYNYAFFIYCFLLHDDEFFFLGF